MRACAIAAGLTLLAVAPAIAGSAADDIAEKFARASEPPTSLATPPQAVAEPASATGDGTAERARLESEREAETLHLAERLRAARKAKADALDRTEQEQRQQRATDAENAATQPAAAPSAPVTACSPAANTATISAVQAAANGSPPIPANTASIAPATILLALDPGNYGIRRFNPTSADPVLCIGETCYVSQGAATPAKAMPRALALGPGNTLGARAGACRQRLTCVFRGVPLTSAKQELEPVDLHILRHDHRETTEAALDKSCVASAGRLSCGTVIRSATYRAVVVPERIAASAGPAALEAALPAPGVRPVVAARSAAPLATAPARY